MKVTIEYWGKTHVLKTKPLTEADEWGDACKSCSLKRSCFHKSINTFNCIADVIQNLCNVYGYGFRELKQRRNK